MLDKANGAALLAFFGCCFAATTVDVAFALAVPAGVDDLAAAAQDLHFCAKVDGMCRLGPLRRNFSREIVAHFVFVNSDPSQYFSLYSSKFPQKIPVTRRLPKNFARFSRNYAYFRPTTPVASNIFMSAFELCRVWPFTVCPNSSEFDRFSLA